MDMNPDIAGNLPLTQAIAGLATSKDEQKKEHTAKVAALDGASMHRYGTGKMGKRNGLNAMFHLAHHLGSQHGAVLAHVKDSSSGPSKSAHHIMKSVAVDICLNAGVFKRKDDEKSSIIKGPAFDDGTPFTLANAGKVLNSKWKKMVAEWGQPATDDTTDDAPSFDDADDDGPTFESIAAGGSEEATVTTTTTTERKAVTVFETLDDFKAFCKTDTNALLDQAVAMLLQPIEQKQPDGTVRVSFARVHHSKSRPNFVEKADHVRFCSSFSSEKEAMLAIVESAGWDALRLKAIIKNSQKRKEDAGRNYDCPAHQLVTTKGATVSGVRNLVRILGAACLVNGGRDFYAARTAANVPQSFADAFLGAFGMDPSVQPVGAKSDRTWRWAYDPTGWDRTAGTNTPSVADLADMFL